MLNVLILVGTTYLFGQLAAVFHKALFSWSEGPDTRFDLGKTWLLQGQHSQGLPSFPEQLRRSQKMRPFNPQAMGRNQKLVGPVMRGQFSGSQGHQVLG